MMYRGVLNTARRTAGHACSAPAAAAWLSAPQARPTPLRSFVGGGVQPTLSRRVPMASPVRFAVVGSNFITDAFLKASKSVPGFQLAAVYSRTAERAAEYAAQHGCERTFTSLEELGACPDVDAVYIASPTSEHAKQSILLLGMGKHILCEKPACSHATELAAVIAAAEASGKAFMEAMRPLKTPNFDAVKAKLAELGPARHFSGTFCQYSSRWPAYLASTASGGEGEVPNAFLPELSNGALMDLGCYTIYSAVALLGAPQAVSYTPMMLPTGVDAGGTVVLKYPDSVATLVISKCSHSWCHSEIQTENGTIRINNLGEWSEVHVQKKGGTPEPLGTEGPGGLGNLIYEVESFVKMVQAGDTQDATLTWDLALQVAKVLDQARDDAGIVFPADSGR